MSERDSEDRESEDQTDADQPLAAVVPKPDSEAAIERLRVEGVYDESRSVREFDDETVALPVTDPPESEVLTVVRQPGAARMRDLDDHLRERGWTEEAIANAPSSWAVLGSVVLVDIGDAPRPGEVGEAILALHGSADTVLARRGISGPHREPDVEVIAGEGDTETVHTEHGTRYAMDLSEVMFSPGNKAERARMGEVVREGWGTQPSERASSAERSSADHSSGQRGGEAASNGTAEPSPGPREDGEAGSRNGEHVVDMFAGIGYFTLPMARAGAEVTAIERNPTSFQYLLENVRLNDVSERVQPYRADCRDVLARVDDETDITADRVVMGYYDATEPTPADSDGSPGASYEYLDSALAALESGGVVHVHEATPDGLVFDRPIRRIREAAAERGREVEILATRRVKGYSEGVVHVVVDARVS